jgi:hypothetical protein
VILTSKNNCFQLIIFIMIFIIEPHTQFGIAFAMFDTDGNIEIP